MTVTIDGLRYDADVIAEELPDVSRAEALQAVMAAGTLDSRSNLFHLVVEGGIDALYELERLIARAVDDLTVLRRVIDAARAHHGIEQPAGAP